MLAAARAPDRARSRGPRSRSLALDPTLAPAADLALGARSGLLRKAGDRDRDRDRRDDLVSPRRALLLLALVRPRRRFIRRWLLALLGLRQRLDQRILLQERRDLGQHR